LESQPHDPEIKTLLRIAVVFDVPIATNRSTADFILPSSYMDKDYRLEEIKAINQTDTKINNHIQIVSMEKQD
jgi:methylglyoxal synthase